MVKIKKDPKSVSAKNDGGVLVLVLVSKDSGETTRKVQYFQP